MRGWQWVGVWPSSSEGSGVMGMSEECSNTSFHWVMECAIKHRKWRVFQLVVGLHWDNHTWRKTKLPWRVCSGCLFCGGKNGLTRLRESATMHMTCKFCMGIMFWLTIQPWMTLLPNFPCCSGFCDSKNGSLARWFWGIRSIDLIRQSLTLSMWVAFVLLLNFWPGVLWRRLQLQHWWFWNWENLRFCAGLWSLHVQFAKTNVKPMKARLLHWSTASAMTRTSYMN